MKSVLFLFLLLLFSCGQDESSSQEEPLQKDSSSTRQVAEPSISDSILRGKNFEYRACHWNSRNPDRAQLSFLGSNQFSLQVSEYEINESAGGYLNSNLIKRHHFQGKYSFSNGRIELQFKEKTTITFGLKTREDPAQSKKLSYQIETSLDTCFQQAQLVFQGALPGFELQKGLAWVENSLRGRYISYAEGVREELIIQDQGKGLQAYYQSPSYKEALALKVLKTKESYPRYAELEVSFPNSEQKYTLSISQNHIYSSKKGSEEQVQYFQRLRVPSQDKAQDLSLQILPGSRGILSENIPVAESSNARLQLQNNYSLQISPSDSLSFVKSHQIPQYQKLQEELCPDKEDFYGCRKQVEAALLKEEPLMKREGQTLIVNQTLLFENNLINGEAFQHFQFLGKIESAYGPLLVVDVTLYEGGYVLLINPRSKTLCRVSSFPYLSPDGQSFLSTQSIGIYRMGGARVDLWKINKEGFQLEWTYMNQGSTPDDFAWLDDQSFIWAGQSFINGQSSSTYRLVKFEN